MDSVEKAQETVDKQGLSFPVLSDAGAKTVIAYDILNEAAEIARVATFIVDGDGVIRYRYVGANKKDRPTPETMLSEIRALSASGG